MVKKVSPEASGRTAPRLRRAYYDCRFGQLHLHNAIPAGGGFDELTAVICLHGYGQTGRVFAPLLHSLGFERSVYALDLPGHGESDPAPGVDPVTAAVQAAGDFVDSMRIRKFDLLARAEGCAAARLLAGQRSQAVRRVVMLADPAERPLAGHPVLAVPAGQLGAPDLAERLVGFLAGA